MNTFRSYRNRWLRFRRFIKRRNKIWCAATSSTGTRLFKRFYHSPEKFIQLLQRGPRESEARYLHFTLQHRYDLIYISHLLSHAVLALDTGLPPILSQ